MQLLIVLIKVLEGIFQVFEVIHGVLEWEIVTKLRNKETLFYQSLNYS